MKSFAHLLNEINEGSTHAALSADMSELLRTVQATGRAGKLTARLKYRLSAGGVKFWYELERPERAIEDAFAGYVNTVREKSDYTVLIGKA